MEAKSLYYGQKGFKSSAEIWYEEGLERGIERGIEKGVEKGATSAIHRTIMVIAKKFLNFPMTKSLNYLKLRCVSYAKC